MFGSVSAVNGTLMSTDPLRYTWTLTPSPPDLYAFNSTLLDSVGTGQVGRTGPAGVTGPVRRVGRLWREG